MQKHAATFLRLAALWLLAGALFKLLMGSPKDLPPSVLSFARGIELNADLTLRLAVAIELVIGVLALLRPKLAWLPITLQFIVFEAILLQMVLGGDASCGCFGSQITVPPQVMLGIDSVVLLCLLLSKPWHQAPAPSPGLPTVLVLLLCGAAPWLVIPPTVDVPIVLTNVSATPIDGPGHDQPLQAWSLPSPLPRYAELSPDKWVGQPVHATQLAIWTDPDQLPLDAHIVIYRTTCEHCQTHLEELALAPQPPMPYILLRIIEKGDSEENRLTHVMPEGIHLELPAAVEFVIETPWDVILEDWAITGATSSREE
ncbi:MAG: hypothetical protein CMK00_00550 [Planctomycetes bacterium]|nr:hypothetical protein [Planctomycetota bacterium]